MSFRDRILRSDFFIKLRSWEYWPFGVMQFPLMIYWLWLSLRARSLLFFSASNPGITMGGMFGESKYDVIKAIPKQYVPITLLIELPITTAEVLQRLNEAQLHFPVIFKPDLGERGYMVKKINNVDDIEQYLQHIHINFLAQEFVDLPLEFGVFYTRFPDNINGEVTSVVMKEMLSVTGDGVSTLQQLILNKDRAKLQWNKLKESYANQLNEIVPKNKTTELVSIGNHALGTKFLDGTHLINERLSSTFDHISKDIKGFYFGRYDIRCASVEDLYNGKIKIMELNGCGAEPAHIYHPGFSMREAFRVLFIHWRNIFLIARQNHKRGTGYTTLVEGYRYYKVFKAARK